MLRGRLCADTRFGFRPGGTAGATRTRSQYRGSIGGAGGRGGSRGRSGTKSARMAARGPVRGESGGGIRRRGPLRGLPAQCGRTGASGGGRTRNHLVDREIAQANPYPTKGQHDAIIPPAPPRASEANPHSAAAVRVAVRSICPPPPAPAPCALGRRAAATPGNRAAGRRHGPRDLPVVLPPRRTRPAAAPGGAPPAGGTPRVRLTHAVGGLTG